MNEAFGTDADAIDLSPGWTFVQRRASRRWLSGAPCGDGTTVDLPHCWNADDDFLEGVAYYRGYGSYRGSFRLGAARGDARLYFETEGFYGLGDVWVNGRRVAAVDGQYLGVSLDVTDAVRFDAGNTIGVRLTNRCGRRALPGIAMPDFLLYGGLSGRARLAWRPNLRFTPDGTAVVTRDVLGPAPRAIVDLRVENRSERVRRCVTAWRVLDAGGVERAAARGPELIIQPNERSRTAVNLVVPGARPWSPDVPTLHTLEGRVIEDGREVDGVRIRFGFREVEFRPRQGCFVNGARVPLRGCNRHECQPGYGRALPLATHAGDAARMRGMGLNFVRLSHYPQHPAFLDACDEQGLLVYAEIASWKRVRGGRWLALAERQMRAMVARDRNHPSIVLWGMGNEGRHAGAFQRLRDAAKDLDQDRPTIYAENHWRRARRRGTPGIPDVWGTNYELEALELGCEASRLKNVVISECCNYPHAERGRPGQEAVQVRMIAEMLERIRGKDWVAGFALWSYNDYGTLRKKRYRRHCGLVDAWRRPKAAAEYLRRLYAGGPSVAVDGAARGDERDGPRSRERVALRPYGAGKSYVAPGALAGAVDRFIRSMEFRTIDERARVRTHNRRYRVYAFDFGEDRVPVFMKVSWANPDYSWSRRLNIAASHAVTNYGRRAVEGAWLLRDAGVATIRPLACWTYGRSFLGREQVVLYERLPADESCRDAMLRARGAPGDAAAQADWRATLDALADGVARMHRAGLHHGAIALGNFLVRRDGPRVEIGVIDTDHVRRRRGPAWWRELANVYALRRLRLTEDETERFLRRYLGGRYRPFKLALCRMWRDGKYRPLRRWKRRKG